MRGRKVLADWQLQVGDKGFIPEHDLIRMFWSGMMQQLTSKVDFAVNENGILTLSSDTKGASIAYQLNDIIGGNHWELYHTNTTLKASDNVVAKAVRIGYKDFGVSEWGR